MNKLTTTLLYLFLFSPSLISQTFDTSFGQNGEIIIESNKKIHVSDDFFYTQKNTNIAGSKEDGYVNEIEIEKYDLKGNKIEKFGINGLLTLKGYIKTPKKIPAVRIIQKHLVAHLYSRTENRFEVYNLKGKLLFTYQNPKFGIDQILLIKKNKSILFGSGSTIYRSKNSQKEKDIFARAYDEDIPTNRPYNMSVFSTTSTFNNKKFYMNYRLSNDEMGDFISAVYSKKGKLQSERVIFSYKKNLNERFWLYGSLDNLAIFSNNGNEYSIYPIDPNATTNDPPTKLSFSDNLYSNYLTKSKKENYYLTGNKSKIEENSSGKSEVKRETYIYSFKSNGQADLTFGNQGVYSLEKDRLYFLHRLNEDSLILLEENKINTFKPVYKIKKLLLE